jgi:hypothetical protein
LEKDDVRQEMIGAFLEKDVMQQRNAMKTAIERRCKWAFKSRKPSLTRSSRSNIASAVLDTIMEFTQPLLSPALPYSVSSIPGKGLGIVANQGVTMSLHDLIHTAGLFGELEHLDDDKFHNLTLAGHPALYSDRCYKGIVFGPVALLNSAGPGERNVLTFSNIDTVEADARVRSKRKHELEAESVQRLKQPQAPTSVLAFSEMERSTRRSGTALSTAELTSLEKQILQNLRRAAEARKMTVPIRTIPPASRPFTRVKLKVIGCGKGSSSDEQVVALEEGQELTLWYGKSYTKPWLSSNS